MCLGVPGKITVIYTSGTLQMAKIDFGGVIREACIEAVPEAKVGDWTIIHAGFALNMMNEEEAQETLDALRQLALIDEEIKTSEQNLPAPFGG
ncbi:MAG TPA: HypC/HybG/HupF family hydrogenase formation chaperone [Anaerolineaceae bacterium]|jgi:hydrogenase expression/formation protein HypC